MTYEPKFSTATLKRAAKVGRIGAQIDMNVGPVRENAQQFGDMVFFMLSNGPDVCIIRCTRYAYFVEYYYDAHRGCFNSDYLMIKNVRNFLLYLKKHNFKDFDIWDTKIAESLQEDSAEFEDFSGEDSLT